MITEKRYKLWRHHTIEHNLEATQENKNSRTTMTLRI